jgi:protein-disulfide isomerase
MDNDQPNDKKQTRHYWRIAIFVVIVIGALAYGWVSLGLFKKLATSDTNTTSSVLGDYVRSEKDYPVEAVERPKLGDPSAQLVIVEFTGYQCASCQAESELIRQVVSLYNGRIGYILRDYPTKDDEWSVRLAEAAACANDQGKFWIMHDRMSVRPLIPDRALLDTIAQGAGLDMESFKSCFDGRNHQARIRQDVLDGQSFGVVSAPTMFVNGRMIQGQITEAELYKIVDTIYPELKSLHENITEPEVEVPTSST